MFTKGIYKCLQLLHNYSMTCLENEMDAINWTVSCQMMNDMIKSDIRLTKEHLLYIQTFQEILKKDIMYKKEL